MIFPSCIDRCRRLLLPTLIVGGVTLAGASQARATIGLLAGAVPMLGATVMRVTATTDTSFFLLANGTVWQVGNFNPIPSQVTGLSNITDIAAGIAHVVASDTGGNVWAWGNNSYGQLGNCSTGGTVLTPAKVRADCTTVPASFVASANWVAAGGYHSLAVISDGTGRAWGRNDSGQLGDGSTTQRTYAVTITEAGTNNTVTGITQLAGGGFHSIALRASNSGKVKAWGYGLNGELGNNSCGSSTRAVDMVDSTGTVFTGGSYISAGYNFSAVTTGGGRVWTTGYNGNGQLGLGSGVTNSCYLQRIGGFTSVALAAGGAASEYVIAVKTDGSVWSWGRNDDGQLGDGTNTNAFTPVTVKDTSSNPLTGFKQAQKSVAASALSSLGINATMLHAGEAWGWGDNIYDALGNR
jgi:alpha-tubulin suppressor-like RCC1 family protein